MQEFEAKRNALFACLDDASNELKGTTLEQKSPVNPLMGSNDGDAMIYRQGGNRMIKSAACKSGLKRLRGKESLFKKPELPIARCLKPKRLPDYQINPHKWKCYSLEDVDISDHTNTAAAFEFLREIDSQKDDRDSSEDQDNMDIGERKIEFKKSSKIRRTIRSLEEQELKDVEIDTPKLKGSKLVMPEYIVGAKPSKGLQKRNINSTTSAKSDKKQRAAGKLTLSHLMEEDDEDKDE